MFQISSEQQPSCASFSRPESDCKQQMSSQRQTPMESDFGKLNFFGLGLW
jgi:hypothetical protein